MAMDVIGQIDELYKIKDVEERIEVAVKKFSNGEISAKAIREVYSNLTTKEKCTLLKKVYAEDVRDNNMKRLPPSILMPEQIEINNSADGILAILLGKYELINEYQNSKSQDKFVRIRNVIEN